MGKTITTQDIYKKLENIEKRMVTKKQLDSLVETMEIMGNPKTMKSIQESEKDIKAGRYKKVESVKEMLKEMDD